MTEEELKQKYPGWFREFIINERPDLAVLVTKNLHGNEDSWHSYTANMRRMWTNLNPIKRTGSMISEEEIRELYPEWFSESGNEINDIPIMLWATIKDTIIDIIYTNFGKCLTPMILKNRAGENKQSANWICGHLNVSNGYQILWMLRGLGQFLNGKLLAENQIELNRKEELENL